MENRNSITARMGFEVGFYENDSKHHLIVDPSGERIAVVPVYGSRNSSRSSISGSFRSSISGSRRRSSRASGIMSAASAARLLQEEEAGDEEGEEEEEDSGDCPICVNPMSLADVSFPLHCPADHCDFNFCANCIKAMIKSEADGYEEASDGSKQVKFHIACPMCRSRYVAPEPEIHQDGSIIEEKKETASPPPPHYDHHVIDNLHKPGRNYHPIVGYCLLLREAFEGVDLLKAADSDLSAGELKKKYAFVLDTTLNDLQEAALNYEIYLKQVHKDEGMHRLNWDDFAMLPRCMNANGVEETESGMPASIERRQAKLQARPWRDPTLFMGLEELMSQHEQEFVTQLMCNNDPSNLAQAAHIMHGVLNAMGTERAIQELSNFGMGAGTPLSLTPGRESKPPKPLDPKESQRLRGRFPLPNHMPRATLLAAYDPHCWSPPFKFENNNSSRSDGTNAPLTLSVVRGIAGRSGLRRGDVVTHLNLDPVTTVEEFEQTMALMNTGNNQVMIVVNAHPENARLLRERAQNMQKAKINFDN